jgi:hypothetical protein
VAVATHSSGGFSPIVVTAGTLRLFPEISSAVDLNHAKVSD